MKINIRPARPKDAADISSLSQQLGYQSSCAAVKKRLENIFSLDAHVVFVACQANGEVVGWIHVFSTHRVESDSFCEIGGLVVAESSRNQGIGAKLIHAAQQWTVQQGIGWMRVRSRKKRHAARQFYLNMGFSLVKEQNIFEKEI